MTKQNKTNDYNTDTSNVHHARSKIDTKLIVDC